MNVERRTLDIVVEDRSKPVGLAELTVTIGAPDGRVLTQRIVRGELTESASLIETRRGAPRSAPPGVERADLVLIGPLRPQLLGDGEDRRDTEDSAQDGEGKPELDLPAGLGLSMMDATTAAHRDASICQTLHGSEAPPLIENTDHTIQDAGAPLLSPDVIIAAAHALVPPPSGDGQSTDALAVIPLPASRRIVGVDDDFQTIEVDGGSGAVIDIRDVLAAAGTSRNPAIIDVTIDDVTTEQALGGLAVGDATVEFPGMVFDTVDLAHTRDVDDPEALRPTEPPQPSQRYVLLGTLGRSTSSELHLAYDLGDDTPALPCVLRRLLAEDPGTWPVRRRRFLTEGRIGCSLRHPHIVAVFDYGEHGGAPVLVRELVDGMNLEALSAVAGDALDVGVVALIGWQVAQGLAYGHSRTDRDGHPLALVHGQLSRSTIIIARNGGAKLTEFGVDQLDGRSLGANCGGRRGSPGYAAPEQRRGEAIDARTDLFALGVILAELLTGVVLGESVEDVAYEVGLLCALRPDVPTALTRLLARMTAADPSARPTSADAVLNELQAILDALEVWPSLDDALQPVFEAAVYGHAPGECGLPSAPPPVPLTQVPELEVDSETPPAVDLGEPPPLLTRDPTGVALSEPPPTHPLQPPPRPLAEARGDSTTEHALDPPAPRPPTAVRGAHALARGQGLPVSIVRRRRAPRYPLRGMRSARPPRLAMGDTLWVEELLDEGLPTPVQPSRSRPESAMSPLLEAEADRRLRGWAHAIIASGLLVIALALYELLK